MTFLAMMLMSFPVGTPDLKTAESYLEQAGTLLERGRADSALALLQLALPVFQAEGLRLRVADAYFDKGKAFWFMDEMDSAMALFTNALSVYREEENWHGVSSCYNAIGISMGKLGIFDSAIAYFEMDLTISRDHGFSDTGSAYLGMANALYYLGRTDSALVIYTRLLEVFTGEQNRLRLGRVYLNMGTVVGDMGDPDSALALYAMALMIFQEGGYQLGVASVYNNMSSVLDQVGDLDSALALADSALNIYLETGARAKVAYMYSNMAVYLRGKGELDTAMVLATKALEVFQEMGLRPDEAMAYRTMALTAREAGHPDTALVLFEKALSICLEMGLEEVRGVPRVYEHMGLTLLIKNEPDSALVLFGKAYALYDRANAPPEMIGVMGSISQAYLVKKDYASMLESSERAITLFQDYQTDILTRWGETSALAMTRELYAIFPLAAIASFRLSKPDTAFYYLDQGRARLLDVQRGLLSLGTGDPVLLRWQRAINGLSDAKRALENARDLALSAAEGISDPDSLNAFVASYPLVVSLNTRIDSLTNEAKESYRELQNAYPQAREVKPASLKDLKKKLGKDELFMEYAIAADSLYAFVVSKKGLRLFNLGPDTLQNIAYRLFLECDSLSRTAFSDQELSSSMTGTIIPLSTELYNSIMSPILKEYPGTRTIHLVPDGKLAYYPLEALMPESGSFLLEKVQIIYYSSGRDFLDYKPWKPRDLYAYAPVVYNLALSQKDIEPFREEEALALRGPGLSILSNADNEVDSVARIWKKGKATLRTRKEASEDMFKKDMRGKPSVVLLATHGNYGWGDDPLTTSWVAFYGASASEKPGIANDGYLTAMEAMTLDMRGVGLVYLSACQTGVGRIGAGEGIMGLRRSFSASGVSDLISTLWSVKDESAFRLSVSFFGNLSQGKSPPEALRSAKLELIHSLPVPHPVLWGPGVISR